jgi:hypothetical protein
MFLNSNSGRGHFFHSGEHGQGDPGIYGRGHSIKESTSSEGTTKRTSKETVKVKLENTFKVTFVKEGFTVAKGSKGNL